MNTSLGCDPRVRCIKFRNSFFTVEVALTSHQYLIFNSIHSHHFAFTFIV